MDSLTINILSLNVGLSNTLAGLPSLVISEDLDLIFLQEVRMSKEQIKKVLPDFNVDVNIDVENASKPGTALLWKPYLLVENVVSPVQCRIQIASLGGYCLINIYAPSGSSKNMKGLHFLVETFST